MMKRKKLLFVLSMLLILSTCWACSSGGVTKVKLDPKNPITINVWHYYNGSQQVAFDEMVNEFNGTLGKEKGIFVQGKGQGDVMGLEEAVWSSIRNEVGSDDVPNIFSSYADTAYAIDKEGYLADISKYLSEKELDMYVDSYIEEGKIGENGELRIFPTAKSSEIFMMSKTHWDEFAAATGVELSLLETKEGLAEAAKYYYEWTDGLTPDIPGDGKSFYGRDALANLFIIGSMQMGTELFEVTNGQVTLNLDKEIMRKIWDFYYVNYVKGYFASYGRFRADDVKINEIIALTGSSASSIYFPDTVEANGEIREIECLVLPEPIFEGGNKYAVQQGAGMVVSKGTPEEEYASIIFLKWFTQKENNIEFSIASSYLPVQKDAYNMIEIDRVIEEKNIDMPYKTYEAFQIIIEGFGEYTLYTNKAFEGGSTVRKILEYQLADKAAADREAVLINLESGMDLEDAVKDFVSDAAFEAWFQEFSEALINATK